ncbi:hypothetical protein HY312_02420 [Candidatus Saccharibacteria bacterium]|nr:hypothetical protein [Candidatus Saccharibacteria bacterium]
MFNSEKRRKKTLEEFTEDDYAAAASELEKDLKALGRSSGIVATEYREAFLETTEKIGDERLTQHVRDHTIPGRWIDPDYIAIIEKVQPGSTELAIALMEHRQKVRRREESKALYSPRNIGRALLKGFGSVQFPN